MTVQEFALEFNLEYNNIMSNQAPGLDLYEMSAFLTQAQEEIVKEIYSSTGGFENTELNRRYLANLIGKFTIDTTNTQYEIIGLFKQYDIVLPTLLVIISEQAVIQNSNCCDNAKIVNVVPTKYDELNKVLNNPFRRPNNNKVIRIDKTSNEVYIISKQKMTKYACEYLKKPSPIILTNLGSMSIDGVSTTQTCQLDSSLHRLIIKYAVQLAAASWASLNKK